MILAIRSSSIIGLKEAFLNLSLKRYPSIQGKADDPSQNDSDSSWYIPFHQNTILSQGVSGCQEYKCFENFQIFQTGNHGQDIGYI